MEFYRNSELWATRVVSGYRGIDLGGQYHVVRNVEKMLSAGGGNFSMVPAICSVFREDMEVAGWM